MRLTQGPQMSKSREITTLYRYFNADGELLYVGISRHPLQRHIEHQAWSQFAEEVEFIKFEKFPSRAEASAAEADAIKHEMPLYNSQLSARQLRSASQTRLLATEVDLQTIRGLAEYASERGFTIEQVLDAALGALRPERKQEVDDSDRNWRANTTAVTLYLPFEVARKFKELSLKPRRKTNEIYLQAIDQYLKGVNLGGINAVVDAADGVILHG